MLLHPRADTDGLRVAAARQYSAAEPIDDAADLYCESTALVHGNERAWRIHHTQVEALVSRWPESHSSTPVGSVPAMVDASDAGPEQLVDGRVARRERNIAAVLAVVIELFGEESLFPTIDQVSSRSGVSLRSLYRYFADTAELLDAAIRYNNRIGAEVAHLHAIGQGRLVDRIDAFAAMRVRVYEHIGPVYRATVANAARHARVREELARSRDSFRHQFELQFAPELRPLRKPEREAVASAGDVMTQLDAVDYLRRHRELSVGSTERVLRAGLLGILER